MQEDDSDDCGAAQAAQPSASAREGEERVHKTTGGRLHRAIQHTANDVSDALALPPAAQAAAPETPTKRLLQESTSDERLWGGKKKEKREREEEREEEMEEEEE